MATIEARSIQILPNPHVHQSICIPKKRMNASPAGTRINRVIKLLMIFLFSEEISTSVNRSTSFLPASSVNRWPHLEHATLA